jgi:hypothetical protein
MLEAALAYYQDFIEQHGDDPSTQAQLEDARSRVAHILRDLLSLQEADPLELVSYPEIQEDLGLSSDQKARIAARWAEAKRGGLPGMSPLPRRGSEVWRQYLAEAKRRSGQAVAEILTPTQARRVRQIQLRLLDVLAFNLPEVVAELRLTPAQRSELVRRFHEERRACGEEIFQKLRGDNTLEELLVMFLEIYPRARERALESLSEEQRARWKELTGEPFRWPIRSLLAREGPALKGWSITFARRPVR